MNCAWCSPSGDGTDGICDACMSSVFGIDPAVIHQEIEAERQTATEQKELEELTSVAAN